MEINGDDLKKSIVSAIVEAENIKEERNKEWWIDREKHYKHHDFMDAFIKFMDEGKSAVLRTFLYFVIAAILGLLTVGIWAKIKDVVG